MGWLSPLLATRPKTRAGRSSVPAAPWVADQENAAPQTQISDRRVDCECGGAVGNSEQMPIQGSYRISVRFRSGSYKVAVR
jgi:hypothetical protein